MRIRGQDLPRIGPEALLDAAAAEVMSQPPGALPFPTAPAAPGRGGPTPAPGKKSRLGLYLGCGCLSVIGLVVLTGGWIFYQESFRGIHVPTDEVASTPVDPGKPFTVQFRWDGTGYAFNNVWLVVDEGQMSVNDFKIGGTFGCGSSASSSPRKIDTGMSGYSVHRWHTHEGDTFSAWIYLGDEYTHASSRTTQCGGVIQPVTGNWTKARVVVTQRQRPSDFFAR
jgi:hypothetical protein